MFRARKRPPLCPSNTSGLGAAGKVALSNGEQNWTEQFDVVTEAAAAIKSRGHTVTSHKTWLEHGDSELLIQPQLAELQPLEGGGVRTATTMQVNHPTLIPAGVFEYQHATGDTVVSSLTKGFDQWVQTDFVTFLDALRVRPRSCTMMEMTFPAKDGKPERVRRAVLGPVTHMAQTPPDAAGGHPPFCPCCLLTNSFETFRDLIEGDAFYGLRSLRSATKTAIRAPIAASTATIGRRGCRRCARMPAPGLRRGTSSASNTWCFKPWSTAQGQPRNKLKVYAPEM
jgi:hypothetical protein